MKADGAPQIGSPRSRLNRPIAIDLFAGAGGLSLGFEQAGFDIVGAVEYDPIHAAVHKYNFPFTPILCRDIRNLKASNIIGMAQQGFRIHHPRSKWPGVVDAIIGGPPCQGFSTGGIRMDTDPRNNLLLEFVRIVEEVRPTTFCLENVAGLLEPRFANLRDLALGRLAQAGYSISGEPVVVDASHLGVPQRRKRVVILGSLRNSAPVSLSGIAPVPVVTVAEAFDGLPGHLSYEELWRCDQVDLSESDSELVRATRSVYARVLSGLQKDPRDRSRPRRWTSGVLTNSLRTRHTPETVSRFAETLPGAVEPKSRFFRLDPAKPARTLRAGTGTERGAHTSPRPIHPTENRVITVREAARLHGYPDWFRFHATNWHGHRQVGNSVPPALARAAADSILSSLGLHPAREITVRALGDPAMLRMGPAEARAETGAVFSQLPAARARQKRS